MKPIKWCEHCFENDRGDKVPDYFIQIWENSYVRVFNCKHCGATFLYYNNRMSYLRTRTRAGGTSMQTYIKRELEQEPRRQAEERKRL